MTASATSNRPAILLDADVVSHFITAGEVAALPLIFPAHQLWMLSTVQQELENWPGRKVQAALRMFLAMPGVVCMPTPEEDASFQAAFFRIKQQYFTGAGETACMAYAYVYGHVLASSNLRDIQAFCHQHRIIYLTTMDFLCEALRTGLFTNQRCNDFLAKVRKADGRLPVEQMQLHDCSHMPDLALRLAGSGR